MKNKYKIINNYKILFLVIIFIHIFLYYSYLFNTIAQTNHETNNILSALDSVSLEDVIVEVYYVAQESDYSDTIGGKLPQGAVTYRIFIDMKPEYSLQMVWGNEHHDLMIETSTYFFNNHIIRGYTGFNIDVPQINQNNIALDSWITLGAATRLHTGILKEEDTNGSIITNRSALSKTDGLTKGNLPLFKMYNLDIGIFNENDASCFYSNNGTWYALGGVKGPTEHNRVLIAQLTTNGTLSFELNVQIGCPSGAYVKFVAKNPQPGEILFEKLKYSSEILKKLNN